MSEHEHLLWSVLRTVEDHTVGRYQSHAPPLCTPAKRRATEAIASMGSEASADAAPLWEAVGSLLDAADGDGSVDDALWLQGIVLEHLGVTLYEALADGQRVSEQGAEVAASAAAASHQVIERACAQLCERHPDPNERFYAFAHRTTPILQRLDTLGVAFDAVFAAPLKLAFADVMGDFVADLLPTCTSRLQFQRRKVMVHLTSALMA